MRNARPVVDWRRQKVREEVQKPFLDGTSQSVDQYHMYNFGVEKLKKLDQEFIRSSQRRRSSGCEISSLSQLKKAPSIFYTDGRGFMLGEHVLGGCNVEMPFHPAVCDLLAVMNMCPVQVGANG